MGKIKVTQCGDIEGLKVIEPTVFGDSRGYFMETYNYNDFKEAGIDVEFVQDNQSSSRYGVLRGLHFQISYPQDKLVRVVNGEVFDVAVDLREGSKTFGKWYGVVLSAENKKQFFIPKGFAHGFLVLSENAEFTYKCSDFYHPNDEGGLIWNDKDINVEWPIPEGMELIFSDKDQKWGLLSQLTASDDGEILDADIVSSADTTEKTVDSSYDDTAASGQNINDTADEAVKVYDGGTQDSSYQNSDEGTSSGETGNGIISDENPEKTQSKSQVDSSFDDSGERVLHHDDDAHSDNSVLHASVSEQLNTDTSFEMSQSQSRLRVDTTDIIRQIVDSMSISNTTEESAINLQLTPESLGRMYINVSQKNSEISARIAVSNEAVKEALQTQMVNLKEALNNSGIRVNEVEITVASHEFERNLEQGAANDSRQQESTNSYNGSNSSDSGIDSDMMQDRVEERLVTQIMRDNGNSVDFTA